MRKYKVAFLISQLSGGGAERVIANLANAFDSNGHEVSVITVTKAENEYALSSNIKRYVLNEMKLGALKPVSRIINLRKLCKKEKFDVVVAFMGNVLYYSIFATIGLKTKSIVSVRNDPNFAYSSRLSRSLAKVLLPMANGCVFQTEDAKKWFPKTLQKKSKIIFNPINDTFYNVTYNPEKNRIITCGRLVEQKNHKMLITAFLRVTERNPEAKLYIYGDGPLKKSLEQLSSDLGLENNIFFMGNVANVANELRRASIFVLPSNVEGAPNALMEAMAIGIPCISTDCPCGGPKMLLEDGKNGILVSVGVCDEMSNAIINLLDDPLAQEYYGASAKRKASEFQGTQIYGEWLRYIDDIV